ncbi:MAG: pilus assembly protein [Hyphomicrobiaceae bacterium]|nr:pilus assembly protein [Hyphomicrobiaceae bacterium]
MAQVFCRFGRARDGATAIEFAMVVTPFLMLVFGVIGIGLFFFTETVLDQALNASARQIRTGQSHQTATGELTVGDLKKDVCGRTAGLISCGKLSLIIQNSDTWDNVTTIPSCTNTSGSVVGSNYADTIPVSTGAGGRERVVIIVACYPWELLTSIPYLGLGNVNGGSAQLIQSVMAFKSEPY